jgi:hypothetical protein
VGGVKGEGRKKKKRVAPAVFSRRFGCFSFFLLAIVSKFRRFCDLRIWAGGAGVVRAKNGKMRCVAIRLCGALIRFTPP